MEGSVISIDDELVPPLLHNLPKTASYIVDRRDVSFFASGSGVYTPEGGARVIRVNLNGENRLVPHSLRMMFTLNKKSGGEARVTGKPWSFLQRVRVMCGGQVVEDITAYKNLISLHLLRAKRLSLIKI